MTTNPRAAERFQQLHADGILVLPNVWDAASTAIAADAGAQAIATSSAAVSWSIGYPDGNALPRTLMLERLAQVVAAAGDLPVSADLESGFGSTDAEVADAVRAILDAGAVGINIEDQVDGVFVEVADQARRIAAVRAAAERAGVALYINARTDTYLVGAGDYHESIGRASSYLDAGASGVFVPGVADLQLIGRLAAAIPAPLNILVGPGSPPVGELAAAGVRRASAGSSIAQAVHGHTRRAMTELLGPGSYESLAGPITHPQMNALIGG